MLVVTRLDRLARSTLDLCRIAEQLKREGVDLHVIDQHIDTSDATGRLLFNMLGAIAQFETEIRAERQADGIRKAKSRGVRLGPAHKLSADQAAELRQRREGGRADQDLDAGLWFVQSERLSIPLANKRRRVARILNGGMRLSQEPKRRGHYEDHLRRAG